jgi:hypothetical protein
MKKLLLILAMLSIVILSACVFDIKPHYSEDKKFVYLINNQVFATRVGDTWYNRTDSTITINDLLSSEAFYTLGRIEDSKIVNEKVTEIAINKFSGEGYNNLEWFNHIYGVVGRERLKGPTIAEVQSLPGTSTAEQYVYELPFTVVDNEDIKESLRVYDSYIEIMHTSDLVSNDANLELLNPTQGNALSANAQNWLNDYATKRAITLSGNLHVKSYSLDIDNDKEKETVYLIYDTMNNFIVDEDKIELLLVEDGNNFQYREICVLDFRSKNANEYFANYMDTWREDLDVRLSDFDHDGNVEILLDSVCVDFEPFDYHELFEVTADGLKLIASISGPGE